MRRAGSTMLAASLLLGGCAGLGDVAPEAAGLGVGAGAGVLTANPLVGVAAAMLTRLATAEAMDWLEAKQRVRVQQAIASAGGEASLDVVVAWKTAPNASLDMFFGAIEGHLQVIRAFGGLIACRELLYTVATPQGGLEGTAGAAEQDVKEVVDAPASSSPPSPTPAAPPEAQSPPAPSSATVVTDWPQAEARTVLVAAICDSGEGWRWAVSRPATQTAW